MDVLNQLVSNGQEDVQVTSGEKRGVTPPPRVGKLAPLLYLVELV